MRRSQQSCVHSSSLRLASWSPLSLSPSAHSIESRPCHIPILSRRRHPFFPYSFQSAIPESSRTLIGQDHVTSSQKEEKKVYATSSMNTPSLCKGHANYGRPFFREERRGEEKTRTSITNSTTGTIRDGRTKRDR